MINPLFDAISMKNVTLMALKLYHFFVFLVSFETNRTGGLDVKS